MSQIRYEMQLLVLSKSWGICREVAEIVNKLPIRSALKFYIWSFWPL